MILWLKTFSSNQTPISDLRNKDEHPFIKISKVFNREILLKMTTDELADRATRYGAAEREMAFLQSQHDFWHELRDGVSRQRSDPAYANEVAKEAAKFDRMLKEVKDSSEGAD